MITLKLPWPPSVNTYWRSPNTGKLAGRTLISAQGRQYRQAVADAVLLAGCPKAAQGRLEVAIGVAPPDRRRRDLDNLPKAILDALTHAGVIEDDSLIDRLLIARGEVYPGGMVHVMVGKYTSESVQTR